MFEKYKAIAKKDISESIKSEMSGHLEEGFLAIGQSLMCLTLFSMYPNVNECVLRTVNFCPSKRITNVRHVLSVAVLTTV